jgi:hypothetical protein
MLEHRLSPGEQRLMGEWLREKQAELVRAWMAPSR